MWKLLLEFEIALKLWKSLLEMLVRLELYTAGDIDRQWERPVGVVVPRLGWGGHSPPPNRGYRPQKLAGLKLWLRSQI